VFVAGDDPDAKEQVRTLLESFGWPRNRIVDLGGIIAARGTEAYILLWLELMGVAGHPHFNIHVVR
jgi:hypothetical protein